MAQEGRHRIRRNRELRSCVECRHRKLKCDRQIPCTACVRRNNAISCVYETTASGLQGERERRLRAEARLEHLEKLVQQLSKGSQPSDIANASDIALAAGGGSSRLCQSTASSEQSSYHGPTHWSAMLEDIQDLRTIIHGPSDSEDIDGSGERIDDETSVLFGTTRPIAIETILDRFLPTKQDTNRYVAAYFRTKAVAASFVHTGHFNRVYQLFWENPARVSPLWISTLFSILDIACRVLRINLESGQDNSFSLAAAHCLAAGNFYRPGNFAVEALLLFAQARTLTQGDIPFDLPILYGTLHRLAITSGYHRDAKNSPNLYSAFEGEMRRRTWSLYMQLDLLISFQLGIPSNIQYPTWDTEPPKNLTDLDFDEDSATLPPARPDSEPTEQLFYITKHRLMAVFEKILRFTLSTDSGSVDELYLIDQELRDTYAAVPSIYLPRSTSSSIVDPPSLTVSRLCVNFIYLKSLCVLHRSFFSPENGRSVQTCYEAASDLVRKFLDVYKEFKPGGQFETERWFAGSLTWHDFLLGCSILCLTVHYAENAVKLLSSSSVVIDIEVTLNLLGDAQLLCLDELSRGRQTRKASRIIQATVQKFNAPEYREAIHESTDQNISLIQSQDSIPTHDDILDESPTFSPDDPTWAYLDQILNF